MMLHLLRNRGNMTYEKAFEKLKSYDQLHVLDHYDELSDIEKNKLLTQISALDLSMLDLCKRAHSVQPRGKVSPLSAMQIPEIAVKHEKFNNIGIDAIQSGKVGAVLLAGGMGTRLGFDGPKGAYNIGIHNDVYIFQRIIENLLNVVGKANTWIHLFIMTSEGNHNETVSFFKCHDYFGYDADYVDFFVQDTAPACDYDGHVYMASKSAVAVSPNGNGGWLTSMANAGILDTVHKEGIEWINVFAVDNVLQRIADPYFIGAVIDSGCCCGSKVVRKNAPDEHVGVMCLDDDRPSIIEYYELTDELMNARDENGNPAYNFGVILNYLFKVSAVEKVMSEKLPLHVVEKKITHIDEKGDLIQPDKPNGYKFETLVLDMIHELPDCLPYEVVREREFAPIKNSSGIDSVESAQALCIKNGILL
jgi:UDP-N-acetylglucosamine/UDP-N-acetylgalactosamine diphosphorylase